MNVCCRMPLRCSVVLALLLAGTGPVHAQSFTRIMSGPHVTGGGASRSVNWVDVNGDGYPDLFVSNGLEGGENNRLFINNGPDSGYTFREVVDDTIAHDGAPSDGSSWADADNDGDLDAFVVNWYNVNNLFYLNDGTGRFTRITAGAAVNDAGYSETCTWGDYDNDGLVDLYVTNSGSPSLGAKQNFLYHNDGGGTFTKILTGPIVTDARYSRGATWVDYDNDGDLDMYVVNERNQANNLYRNQLHETGTATFVRVATGAPVTDVASSLTASWGDIDNDGDLDLFVGNGWPAGQTDNLYLNNGDSTFTTVTSGPVVSTPGFSLCSGWGDYDNDGDLDLFVTTAYSGSTTPNLLYRNMLRETDTLAFEQVTTGDVATDLANSYGFAWGDYDRDGDLDLYVARTTNENEDNALYRNDEAGGRHWLGVRCVGTAGNRAGIGARVYVTTGGTGGPVRQLRVVEGQSGYCGQNLELHVGLGAESSAESVLVVWPSGTIDLYRGVPGDRYLTLTEGETGYGQACIEVMPGWNLVSLPRGAGPDSVGALFGGVSDECAFSYGPGGYGEACVIGAGAGYWLKCRPGTVCVSGTAIAAETVAVQSGWNLLPSISAPVPVTALVTDPPGILASPVYGFDGEAGGGYRQAAVIEPGRAYWVKVVQAGLVILTLTPGALRMPPAHTEEGKSR
jgi:enediyne biosynthesis protein E4